MTITDEPRTLTRLSVGIDIDDVIARWYDDSHARCVQAGITNGVTPKTWRPYEEYGCTDQEWYDTLHKALLDGYLLEMGIYPGAEDALRRLWAAGHYVHLITARGFFQDPDLIREHTRLWLQANDLMYDSLTFTKDKGGVAHRLHVNHFVDDQPRNIDSVLAASNAKCYLVSRPWNRDVIDRHLPADLSPWRRIKSLSDFADIVIREGQHARHPNH